MRHLNRVPHPMVELVLKAKRGEGKIRKNSKKVATFARLHRDNRSWDALRSQHPFIEAMRFGRGHLWLVCC